MSEQHHDFEQHARLPGIAPITQVTQHLVAIVAAREYKLAMVLGGPARWRTESAYTFLPLELPGAALPLGTRPASQGTAIARRALGCEAWVVSSPGTYGPSEQHRADRIDTAERPVPLVRVERLAPVEDGAGLAPRLGRVLVRIYLTEFQGDPRPAPGTAGLLFLPLEALRQAVRGMPLGDLLALKGVECVTSALPEGTLPENALVYVSGEYGERHLLRATAKYGPEILEG